MPASPQSTAGESPARAGTSTNPLRWFANRRRLIGEGIWVALGQGAAILGALVGVRLLTEVLPPRVFGEVMLFLGAGALALALAGTPLAQAVLRQYPDAAASGTLKTLRAAASRQFALSGARIALLSAVVLIVYSQISGTSLWIGLSLLLLLALDLMRSHELAFLNGARRQRPLALWTGAEAWLRPMVATLGVVLVGASSVSVLTGFVVASGVTLLIFRATCVREGIAPDTANNGVDVRTFERGLFQYALPLMPLGLVSWLSNQADRYFIGGVIGLEQAGLYAAAYGLASRPAMSLCGIVEVTLRPVYYAAVSSGDEARARRIFLVWLAMVAAIAGGVFLVFLLFSDVVAGLLLGAPYRSSASLIPIIAGGYSLLAVAQVFAGAMYANRDTQGVLATEASGALARVSMGIAGTYLYGVTGAAASVVAAFTLQLVVAAGLTRRSSGHGSATKRMEHS